MFVTRPGANAVAPRTPTSVSAIGRTPTAEVWNTSLGLGSQTSDRVPGPVTESVVAPPPALSVKPPVNVRIGALGAVRRYGDTRIGSGTELAIRPQSLKK
jgi:hypothetical protein